jgi:hypothetical protein
LTYSGTEFINDKPGHNLGKGMRKVLGLEGLGVILAYVLSIAMALLCVVYGVINWNKSGEKETAQIEEEIAWEKNEPEVVETGGVK